MSIAELEKAVSVSLKPSQYAGWEIGTTANALFREGVAKRVALIWPQPYTEAMADWRLLEIYDTFKETGLYAPERFLMPAEDFQKELKRLGLTSPTRFSLESKRPLEDFDIFIIKKPIAQVELDVIQKIAQAKFRAFFFVPEEAQSLEFLWKELNLTRGEAKESAAIPLVAFSSGDSQRLRYCLEGKSQSPSSPRADKHITRYRVKLRRWAWARFISHLEQIQLIKNVLLLSGLPLVKSFSKKPKPLLSFGPAVSVGWASESEFFDMELTGSLNINEIDLRLRQFWPPGFKVAEIQRIPRHFPSLEASANWTEFLIEGSAGVDWGPLLEYARAVKENVAPSRIVRKEKAPDKVDLIDLRAVVGECLELEAPSGDRRRLMMGLRFGSKRNLKPEKILEELLGFDPKYIAQEICLTRIALAFEFQGGHKRYL